MKLIFLAIAVTLSACDSLDPDDARKCGVTDAQLRRGMEEARDMRPYSGKKIGQCDLIVDDGRNVTVITPEIQRDVENMIAHEKAESNR